MSAPKSKKICSVAWCLKPTRRGQPYCYAHYMKKWRYGTPTPQHQEYRIDLTGTRYDELVVTGYAGGGYWHCKCDCGQEITRRAGELNRAASMGNGGATCGDRAIHRRLEWVDYSGAHCRMRADKGPASNHACVDCNKPAQEWSYDNNDPDEFIGQAGLGKGCKYSLKPEHYVARCVPCHRRFDWDTRRDQPKLPCELDDCDRPRRGRKNLCERHYQNHSRKLKRQKLLEPC